MLQNKLTQRSLILLIFIFIISNFFLLGQQDFINNRPKLNAQFIDTNITIDFDSDTAIGSDTDDYTNIDIITTQSDHLTDTHINSTILQIHISLVPECGFTSLLIGERNR